MTKKKGWGKERMRGDREMGSGGNKNRYNFSISENFSELGYT